MKEIKFRAWIKEQPKEKSWIYKWNINEIDAMLGIDREIMQYTGLKDKNGKEIYEGDILKYENGKIKVFKDIRFAGNFEATILPEIVGNIHQNQELLTN